MMLPLLLALAVAAPPRRGPIFDPVIVRPGIQAPDAGPAGGSVIRYVPICTGGFSALWSSDGGLQCGFVDAGTIKTVTASSPLVATPDGGGGVDISFPLYETSGALTIYLATTGSDSNNCTAVGTPCLTWSGIMAKLPKFLRHQVTINVAAGTYTGAAQFYSLYLDTTSPATSPVINVVGPAQTAFSPSTGTASGTLTAVSSNGVTDYSVVTDGAQTWTSGNLAGSFFTIAGVSYPIATNTATTVSLATALSPVPSVGAAYTITRPAAIISTSGTAALEVAVLRSGRSNRIQFSDIEFVSSGSLGVIIASGTSVDVRFTRCRLGSSLTGTALSTSATSSVAGVQLLDTYITGGVTGTVSVWFDTVCTHSGRVVLNPPAGSAFTFQGAIQKTTGGVGSINLQVSNTSGGSIAAGNMFLTCGTYGDPAGANQLGVLVQAPNSTTSRLFGGGPNVGTYVGSGLSLSLGNLHVRGCNTAIAAGGSATTVYVADSFSSVGDASLTGQCVNIVQGATVRMPSSSLSCSSSRTDFSIGDTEPVSDYSFALVQSLRPQTLRYATTGSSMTTSPRSGPP